MKDCMKLFASLKEVFSNSLGLMNHILHANDAIVIKSLSSRGVIYSPLSDFVIATHTN